ncbi:hypothetical protein [Nocardioides albus]|uniref:Uncharacterized protein n=1 Tax=Nocardioides albus TaxID=1841 RepID=A0A7W5A2E0_9ACTN|nr:hypothetical protein [Nocardioides albus]MBB3088427.1 hypothetical protein [Nocardioides albus]
MGASEVDGARGPAGRWWRGWAPWISALVLSALFAGTMSGIAFVRKSYQPPVDYPAMNETEPVATASTAASPAGKQDRLETSPRARPAGKDSESKPAKPPRKVRPSASASASDEPTATAAPSERPLGPLEGLSALLGLGGD